MTERKRKSRRTEGKEIGDEEERKVIYTKRQRKKR
jgi:hypothetical protein